jgi:heme oxygenase
MVGPIRSAERYRAFVSASHAHRQAVEDYLGRAEWPAAFGPWRPTALAGLIAKDLADLGLETPPSEPLDLSNDIACALGVAYVLEGSALGARLIARMAADLGFGAGYGARHLAGQERGLANWREFLVLVEDVDRVDRDLAAVAASASFDHAARAMKQSGFC